MSGKELVPREIQKFTKLEAKYREERIRGKDLIRPEIGMIGINEKAIDETTAKIFLASAAIAVPIALGSIAAGSPALTLTIFGMGAITAVGSILVNFNPSVQKLTIKLLNKFAPKKKKALWAKNRTEHEQQLLEYNESMERTEVQQKKLESKIDKIFEKVNDNNDDFEYYFNYPTCEVLKREKVVPEVIDETKKEFLNALAKSNEKLEIES